MKPFMSTMNNKNNNLKDSENFHHSSCTIAKLMTSFFVLISISYLFYTLRFITHSYDCPQKKPYPLPTITHFSNNTAPSPSQHTNKTTPFKEKTNISHIVEKLPNPFQAALASALTFSVGVLVPPIAAVFIRNHKIRMGVVAAAVSLALLVFGGVGAVLGKTPVTRSCRRVLVGGCMAMAITFGLTKLIGSQEALRRFQILLDGINTSLPPANIRRIPDQDIIYVLAGISNEGSETAWRWLKEKSDIGTYCGTEVAGNNGS
ncbi:hypothetical protein JHK82_055608 [Glycine max]|nr:hypothetical protein JHK82_055608 [Glycine max]